MVLLLLLACSREPVIAEADLRAWTTALADDAMRGRGALENERAADWLEDRLRAFGYGPLPGQPGLSIPFSLWREGFVAEGTDLRIGDRVFAGGTDLRPFSFSDAGVVEADVVFAGYGITSPEDGWDDYAGLDVAGRLVLVLRHAPHEDEGRFDRRHSFFGTKAKNAAAHGARGMLLVTDPLLHDDPDDLRMGAVLGLEEPAPEEAEQAPPFVAAHISEEAASALVADLPMVQRRVNAGTRPADLGLPPVQATLRVAAARAEERAGRNVVGFLPGRARPDEWVVLGAHYDHLGAFTGEGDTIFNGADDNASGVAGVLAVAKALAADPPERSVAVAFFDAEEHGLLGSRALVGELPTDDLVFMLNLDMIGRNPDRPVELVGMDHLSGLDLAPATEGLEVHVSDYRSNSDHDPFVQAAVPALHVHTGDHDDYHQRSDHADLLDFPRMARITHMSLGLARQVASGVAPRHVRPMAWLGARAEEDARGRLVLTEVAGLAAVAGAVVGDVLVAIPERGEPGEVVSLALERGVLEVRMPVPGWLGIRFGAAERGVGIGEVVPGSPAAEAGLRAGDVVRTLDGEPVDRRSLLAALRERGPGTTVQLGLLRESAPLDTTVTLGEPP